METGKRSRRRNGICHTVLSVIGVLLCIIFGMMLVCNLTIIIKGAISPDRPPSVLGVTPMVVKSGSMSGTADGHIEVGDLIFVGSADPDELRAGDVIAFMDGSVVVTHRIAEIRVGEDGTRSFITRGDANNAPDERPVTEEMLVGVYKSRIPGLGDFALFLQTPLGMLVFIGVPLLAFIIYDVIRRQIVSAKEKQRSSELQAELDRMKRQESASEASAQQ